MADIICIALSAKKNLRIPKYLDSVELSREKKYFIDNSIYKRADQMIWPIQQRLIIEDATPRNLVIDLYTNVFGGHLHVIGELLERPPVLAAQLEVDRLDL